MSTNRTELLRSLAEIDQKLAKAERLKQDQTLKAHQRVIVLDSLVGLRQSRSEVEGELGGEV